MTQDAPRAFDSDAAREGLLALLRALDAAGIDHYLTGALVRNLLGSARTSEDFDVVVDTHANSHERVRDALASAGYQLEGPLKGNLGERFVTEAGGFETDVWLPPDTETARHEMRNRKAVEWHGTRVWIMDPEDYVLRKLVTWRRVRRKTTDLDDAYQVLFVEWESIDAERLVQRAGFHRVTEAMRELVDLVREDRAKLARGEGLE